MTKIPKDPTLPADLDAFVSTRVAAAHFGRSGSTIRRWCGQGWIDCMGLGGRWYVRRHSRPGFPPGMDKFELRRTGPKSRSLLLADMVSNVSQCVDNV